MEIYFLSNADYFSSNLTTYLSSDVNETGIVYYQTCEDEDAVCEYFGIEEEYCNKTTCDIDLCNINSAGDSKIAYTLSLVSVAIVYLFW